MNFFSQSICIFLILMFINLNISLCLKTENIPEMPPEVLADFEASYIKEDDPDQKKYIEPVIRPEKFDLNKDRKISKEELKEAIIYVIYPKDKKKSKNIPDEVKKSLKNNIDLYVSNIPNEFLTFRQFSHVMSQVTMTQFFDVENIKGTLSGLKQKVDESSFEL
jgi:hypothetical protein